MSSISSSEYIILRINYCGMSPNVSHFLTFSFTLKMVAARWSEMFVSYRCHKPENHDL